MGETSEPMLMRVVSRARPASVGPGVGGGPVRRAREAGVVVGAEEGLQAGLLGGARERPGSRRR